MSKFALCLAAALLLTGAASAQVANPAPVPPQQPEPPVVTPNAPELPYRFAKRPVAPNGEEFGNVLVNGGPCRRIKMTVGGFHNDR